MTLFSSLSLCQGDEDSFILKSCTRRKTDSIEKRFCFDVEAVDRSVFIPCCTLSHVILIQGSNCVVCSPLISVKQQPCAPVSMFKSSYHIYGRILLNSGECLVSKYIYK